MNGKISYLDVNIYDSIKVACECGILCEDEQDDNQDVYELLLPPMINIIDGIIKKMKNWN